MPRESQPDDASRSPDPPAPRRRRRRYSGTHPRRFDERYKELDPDRFPGAREHVLAQGRTPAGTHVPVLVDEVLATLAPAPGDVVADCTVGFGGHAQHMLTRIGPNGLLIGLDVDGAELRRTQAHLAGAAPQGVPRLSLHRCHFAGLPKVLRELRVKACDVILADLGVSSMQIDDARRGFSYKHNGPLDMRMDDRSAHTAAQLLEAMSAEELELALRSLGDEPDAGRIARKVIDRRRVRPIATTGELVDIVFEAKRMSRSAWRERVRDNSAELHPAARTFQALRILVNDELSALEQLLRIAPHCLRAGGRLGIISFHSGEDDRVADSFRAGALGGLYSAIAEQPIRPTSDERAANPRSASARLRWAIRSDV